MLREHHAGEREETLSGGKAAGRWPRCGSHRRLQVLYLVCQGLDYKQMAVKLDMSPATLKNYVSQLLLETNCQNRIELINQVIKMRLLPELGKRVGHDFD